MNSVSSPSLAARLARPVSMERYKWPWVVKSWPRGSSSAADIGSGAGPTGSNPSASNMSMPSGRSR